VHKEAAFPRQLERNPISVRKTRPIPDPGIALAVEYENAVLPKAPRYPLSTQNKTKHKLGSRERAVRLTHTKTGPAKNHAKQTQAKVA